MWPKSQEKLENRKIMPQKWPTLQSSLFILYSIELFEPSSITETHYLMPGSFYEKQMAHIDSCGTVIPSIHVKHEEAKLN